MSKPFKEKYKKQYTLAVQFTAWINEPNKKYKALNIRKMSNVNDNKTIKEKNQIKYENLNH